MVEEVCVKTRFGVGGVHGSMPFYCRQERAVECLLQGHNNRVIVRFERTAIGAGDRGSIQSSTLSTCDHCSTIVLRPLHFTIKVIADYVCCSGGMHGSAYSFI